MLNATKRDLVIDLSNENGLTQAQVVDLVESFISLLSERLAQGQSITLRGFGTFEVRVAKSKIGRNPGRPGSEVRIPDRCVVRFKPGRQLKDAISRVPVEKVLQAGPVPAEE
jgi:nucleoid DNA-binding protein